MLDASDVAGLARSFADDPHCPDAVASAKAAGLRPGTPAYMSHVIRFIEQFPYVAPSVVRKEMRVVPNLPDNFKEVVVCKAVLLDREKEAGDRDDD